MTSRPARVPRILLVSGVPPGTGNVGEIILGDVVRACPPATMASFVVPPRQYKSAEDPSLASVPVRYAGPRFEDEWRRRPGRMGALAGALDYRRIQNTCLESLTAAGVAFGEEQGTEKVLVVLESATFMGLGLRIADRLGVPLLSLVWDAPEHLLSQHGFDRFSRRDLMKRFAATLRRSERVAVVSENMRDDYRSQYGANTVLLRHGVGSASVAVAEQRHGQSDDRPFIIGFAGSLYSQSAFQTLLDGLAIVEWRIGGRPVLLRLMGSYFRIAARGPARIELLGFRSVEETAELLALSDANYLPIPFEDSLHQVSRYSFPTKLSTYVAAGRPILTHAPLDSAVCAFLRDRSIGPVCTSLDPAAMATTLRAMSDDDETGRAEREVAVLASGELSRNNFHAQLATFLGVAREDLAPCAR